MTCDGCKQLISYCFYIDKEHWLNAVGAVEGYLCAHCILQRLGGFSWYIIWNEPNEKIRINALSEETSSPETERVGNAES